MIAKVKSNARTVFDSVGRHGWEDFVENLGVEHQSKSSWLFIAIPQLRSDNALRFKSNLFFKYLAWG